MIKKRKINKILRLQLKFSIKESHCGCVKKLSKFYGWCFRLLFALKSAVNLIGHCLLRQNDQLVVLGVVFGANFLFVPFACFFFNIIQHDVSKL